MTRYSIDLPFFMSLNEVVYPLVIGGIQVQVQHSVVQRDDFDPRIGGITAGSFGLVRDQFGALRYSRLTAEIDDEAMAQVCTLLTGRTAAFLNAEEFEIRARRKAEIALALFNRFLDKYRVATRKLDVKPIGPWDLALLTFDDGQNSGEVRLYGGGITLPIAGLIPEYQRRVAEALVDPVPNAAYELAAVDALRTVEDGQPLESIVTAIGALEAALDLYFARTWRLANPRVLPSDAATQLHVAPRKLSRNSTVEDVLQIAGVRAKVTAYALELGTPVENRDDLYDAIRLRNLVVHGGVRIPPRKARRHVQKLADFVLDEITPRIRADCPTLPRPELLYACEEALGNGCSPHLQQIADTYFTPHGLTAKLYNERFKRQEMSSERFGDTLILQVSFRDFAPEQVNLFIAQALLYHYLERRGDVAQARTADELPWDWEESRPFFEHVASVLTRSVWKAAISRRLRELGFDQIIQRQAQREAGELRSKYRRSFIEPAREELGYWTDYLAVAHVAAELQSVDRGNFLHAISSVAPETVRRSLAAIPAMEDVEFDDLDSIRDALIQVHDAHQGIMGTVSIFDPVTRQRYGWGTRLEDLGIQVLRPAGG